MIRLNLLLLCVVSVLLVPLPSSFAETKVIIQHRANEEADSRFRFNSVPRPSSHDAASTRDITERS